MDQPTRRLDGLAPAPATDHQARLQVSRRRGCAPRCAHCGGPTARARCSAPSCSSAPTTRSRGRPSATCWRRSRRGLRLHRALRRRRGLTPPRRCPRWAVARRCAPLIPNATRPRRSVSVKNAERRGRVAAGMRACTTCRSILYALRRRTAAPRVRRSRLIAASSASMPTGCPVVGMPGGRAADGRRVGLGGRRDSWPLGQRHRRGERLDLTVLHHKLVLVLHSADVPLQEVIHRHQNRPGDIRPLTCQHLPLYARVLALSERKYPAAWAFPDQTPDVSGGGGTILIREIIGDHVELRLGIPAPRQISVHDSRGVGRLGRGHGRDGRRVCLGGRPTRGRSARAIVEVNDSILPSCSTNSY